MTTTMDWVFSLDSAVCSVDPHNMPMRWDYSPILQIGEPRQDLTPAPLGSTVSFQFSYLLINASRLEQ